MSRAPSLESPLNLVAVLAATALAPWAWSRCLRSCFLILIYRLKACASACLDLEKLEVGPRAFCRSAARCWWPSWTTLARCAMTAVLTRRNWRAMCTPMAASLDSPKRKPFSQMIFTAPQLICSYPRPLSACWTRKRLHSSPRALWRKPPACPPRPRAMKYFCSAALKCCQVFCATPAA